MRKERKINKIIVKYVTRWGLIKSKVADRCWESINEVTYKQREGRGRREEEDKTK